MAQIKVGALREFEGNTNQVFLIQKGQFNALARFCKKEYSVLAAAKTSCKVVDNKFQFSEKEIVSYHFDNFVEAQDKYLELAQEDNKAIKVGKWNTKDWKNMISK